MNVRLAEAPVGVMAGTYGAGGRSRVRRARHLEVVREAPGPYAADTEAVHPDEVLALLQQVAELASRADLGRLTDKQLLEHATAVDRQVTRIHAQQARTLREVDTRKAHLEVGCVTTASWWRLATNRNPNEASKLVRTAGRLRWLDRTRQALEAGEITFGHAATIARLAIPQRRDAIVEAEDTLVALARRATPRDVYKACRKVADAVDRDGTDGRCAPDPGRELFFARTWKGRGDLHATLDPLVAERFEALLHAYSTPDPADTPILRKRTPAQIRHDAFDAILRAAQEHPDVPSVHGAKPHALLMMDLFTLLGRSELATHPTKLGSGHEIGLARALHLLEQAKLTPVLTLGPWQPVALGRTRRVLPTALRPLLRLLHPHCRGPGCDRPFAWTQAAHLDAWDDGGETRLDETVAVCQAHHSLMDIAGWKVERDPTTNVCTWTSPSGDVVVATHPPDP